ncbi:hypothetical protein C8N32_10960 [Rhodovulum imhoffii]|uniref:Aminoglycoside phosphotransferase domain-containing protein n=1 Tax=Rhodovulum imhoffii TaxID=365340 RepID=A0A2T5BRN1_9RHOB|nr:phosphotransferase [Rhodovulum imhoffii]MBK5934051.1 aminoglycoside phosphotransferase [Rhodovulum imhoffii]PTN01936.1 hypothetical protein C8N32_10960 [Rhodovulum imhoffii]
MTERAFLATRFVEASGWGAATRTTLAGDASARRYERLTDPDTNARAVLMDADTARGEDVRPFITIAEHLLALGLSAPRILARDTESGFLMLEDLGDDLYARVVPRAPDLEEMLYETATDLLANLHQTPPPAGIAAYDPPLMAEMACQPFDWYLPAADAGTDAGERAAFRAVVETLLRQHCDTAPVLVLRDYHAENLLWLPMRRGVAQVGLLDFQDAMAGHRAYDLISLLEDARRDVPPALAESMIARYLARTGLPEAPFRAACAVLGAQRNLRIIGVFARLCVRDGKPGYLKLMQRVWGHLQNDLSHPALTGLRARVDRLIPEPGNAILKRIEAKCPMP